MKSISLTSSAKVFFSLLAAAFCVQGVLADGENYSLWPRRPEALAEARRLMDCGSLPKALELLQPLAEQGGVVGKEAKELIGRLRIRQLLDPNGPDVKNIPYGREIPGYAWSENWIALRPWWFT